MNGEVANQLKALIKHYGTALCDDPKRCRALLIDHVPQDWWEREIE